MELKEAYNTTELVEKLKSEGLDIAEDAAVKVLDVVLEWVAESAAKSETPFDDLIATIFPMVKGEVLKLIDEIDGEVG